MKVLSIDVYTDGFDFPIMHRDYPEVVAKDFFWGDLVVYMYMDRRERYFYPAMFIINEIMSVFNEDKRILLIGKNEVLNYGITLIWSWKEF